MARTPLLGVWDGPLRGRGWIGGRAGGARSLGALGFAAAITTALRLAVGIAPINLIDPIHRIASAVGSVSNPGTGHGEGGPVGGDRRVQVGGQGEGGVYPVGHLPPERVKQGEVHRPPSSLC